MLLLIALACTPEPEETKPTGDTSVDTGQADTAPPVDTGPTRPEDGFYGDIVDDEVGLTSTMVVEKAFGLAIKDTLIVYLSSSPAADCKSVTEYLTPGVVVDPTAIRPPERCDMYLKVANWDGSFEAEDDRLAMVYSAMTCGFGPGKFVYEERGKGDFDYYYSGRWWQGIPEAFNLSVTETSDGFHLEGEMTVFDGTFVYEELSEVKAHGLVWGEVEIEPCPDFKSLF